MQKKNIDKIKGLDKSDKEYIKKIFIYDRRYSNR